MYIMVDTKNIIVGSAVKPIDTAAASKSGLRIYEIPDAEYNDSMLGGELEAFEFEAK